MKKWAFLMVSVLVLVSPIFLMVPSSQAQTKEEKQFMKQYAKEMTTFMEKCTGCHSAQRILAKKASKEECDKVLKVMAGTDLGSGNGNKVFKKIAGWSREQTN